MYDRLEKWGENVTDPLAVRELDKGDEEEIIMTNAEGKKYKDAAIRKID